MSPPELDVDLPVTILVAGGPGTGTTTLLAAVGDDAPLVMSGGRPAHPAHGRTPVTPLAAFDYATVDISTRFSVRVIGLPNEIAYVEWFECFLDCAAAAVVLVDPDMLSESYPFLALCERRRIPHVVAIVSDRGVWRSSDLRSALSIAPDRELLWIDPRCSEDARETIMSAVAAGFAETVSAGLAR